MVFTGREEVTSEASDPHQEKSYSPPLKPRADGIIWALVVKPRDVEASVTPGRLVEKHKPESHPKLAEADLHFKVPR